MRGFEKISDKLRRGNDITFDFVGDSVTWGLSHCTAEETYVACFARLFAEKFPEYEVVRYDGERDDDELKPIKSFSGPIAVSNGEGGTATVIRNGMPGNTVARAINRHRDFTGPLPNGERADITFLMFGINDSITARPEKYVTPSVFKVNYRRLLEMINEDNPDGEIIILSATCNDFDISEHCKASKELAEDMGIPYFDLFDLWSRHYDERLDSYGHGEWLRNDPCHPSPVGAMEIARFVFREFVKLLSL